MEGLEKSITNKLKELDIEQSILKPFINEYLIKIEQIISEKEKTQSVASNTLKTNKFSVASISKTLNCSRTTLYNHGAILKKYIELSEERFKENNPFEINQNLKDDKSLLESQIKQLIERDVNIQVLSYEIDVHQNTIIEKNEEIQRLQERNAELAQENRKLKKEILKSTSFSE